jgi:hypothetical protein
VEGKFGVNGSLVRAVCATCSGTGKHRYADQWRMQFLGMEDQAEYRSWETQIRKVHDLLSSEDVQTVTVCLQQLERFGEPDSSGRFRQWAYKERQMSEADEWKEKLRAVLEGLGCQDIDVLMTKEPDYLRLIAKKVAAFAELGARWND